MTNKPRSLQIAFAGTPDFAAHHLRALLEDGRHQVVAVYTQPDRPSGRGKKLTASPVKTLAAAHQLPVCQPASLKSPEDQATLAAFDADIMVVVAYGLLLPKAILDTPRLGCINVHASLLPRWRGAAPIQRAIEAGDNETGITIMQMDLGLDTGDMLLKAHCPVADNDTGGSLHDKLAQIGLPALLATLDELASGCAVAEVQDNSLSNYAAKISKAEALVNWSEPAETILRKIRAFNPFPVAFTTIDDERLRIWQAETAVGCSVASPGTICNSNDSGILVCTGDGSLRITELQLPGKKRLPVAEILKSRASLFAPDRVLGQ